MATPAKIKGAREVRPGVWELRVNSGRDPVTGKRRQVSEYVHTTRVAEVKAAMAALVVKAAEAQAPETSGTFAYLLEEWFAHASATLKPSTLEGYRKDIDTYLVPALGTKPLRSLTNKDLEGVYGAMVTMGRAPSTINGVHAVARRALNQALAWGWVNHNVALTTSNRPKKRKRKATLPTMPQFYNLVDNLITWDEQVALMVVICASLGTRRGELVGLRWSDLDWDKGTVTICRAVVVVKGKHLLTDTKTHADRTLSLDAGNLDLLRGHYARQVEQATWAGVTLADDGYIFSRSADGSEWIGPAVMTDAFGRACMATGLVRTIDDPKAEGGRRQVPFCRLHDLRHFNASLQLAAKVPIATVSKRLGHANISTTLDIYAHAMPADDQAAADILGGLLGRPAPKALPKGGE